MGLVSTEIVDFLKALPELLSTISDGIASLAAGGDFECDAGSRSAAVAVTNTVSNSVCEASELLVEFRTYLECENWYPLYEESMYNAMCYEGTVSGLYVWLATRLLCNDFFSYCLLL